MKNRKSLLIVPLLIFAILISGCGRDQLDSVDIESLKTEPVELGSLNAFVGGTGTVRANQNATLVWQVPGQINNVEVKAGQVVKEGDVLADLVKTSLPQNVILAQADMENALEALDDFYDSFNDLGIAQAEKNLADARDAVQDAGIRLNNLKHIANQDDIDAAFADLVLAEDRLTKARNYFERFEDRVVTNVERAGALTAMNQAQISYDSALRTYNYITGTADDIEIAKAQADLELAKIQLTDSEEEYDRVLAGPTENNIAVAEAQVVAAQATLDQAMIKAPFDGEITQIEIKSGDLVSSGSLAFRIDDLSGLFIDVNISEIDINQIEIGQDVILQFDAILASEYHGEVVEVSSVGENIQGIVGFQVSIEILDADAQVKSGMTAAVNIIVSQLEDVLLVPNRAVRTFQGNRVVYIIKDSQLTPINIILGASSDTHSEVIQGDLEEGDEVVINPPTIFQPEPGGRPGNDGGRGENNGFFR